MSDAARHTLIGALAGLLTNLLTPYIGFWATESLLVAIGVIFAVLAGNAGNAERASRKRILVYAVFGALAVIPLVGEYGKRIEATASPFTTSKDAATGPSGESGIPARDACWTCPGG
jgi:hypothetical protein